MVDLFVVWMAQTNLEFHEPILIDIGEIYQIAIRFDRIGNTPLSIVENIDMQYMSQNVTGQTYVEFEDTHILPMEKQSY